MRKKAGRTPRSSKPEEERTERDPAESEALRAIPAPSVSEWPDLLRGSRPRDILARLVDKDPLDLERRCERRIRECQVLMDQHRLAARAASVIAYASWRDGPQGPLDALIAGSIDRALDQLLKEDREEDRSGINALENEARYGFLADILGVAPGVALRATVVFNGLPRSVRAAFWAVVFEGKSLRRAAAEGLGKRRGIEADVKRAMLAISLLRDPYPPEERGGRDA